MTAFEPLINRAANSFKFNDPAITRDDLRQVGWLGLLKAKQTWRPERATSIHATFESWAWFTIMQEITKFLNKNHRAVKTTQIDDMPERVVEIRRVWDKLTPEQQRIAQDAIALWESGYHRTDIRRILRAKYGVDKFNEIKKIIGG